MNTFPNAPDFPTYSAPHFRTYDQHENAIRAAFPNLDAYTATALEDDDMAFVLRRLDQARDDTRQARFGFGLRIMAMVEVAIIAVVILVAR